MKKVMVSLDEVHWDIIEKDLKGKLADSSSGAIRNIVVSWLGEHGYLDKVGRK